MVEFIKRAIMHSKNGKFLYFLRSRVPGEHPSRTEGQLLLCVQTGACREHPVLEIESLEGGWEASEGLFP